MCPDPQIRVHTRIGHRVSMWQTKGNMAHSFIAFGIFNAMSEVGGPEVNLDVGCRFCILDCEIWRQRHRLQLGLLFPHSRGRTNIKGQSYKTLAHINHFSPSLAHRIPFIYSFPFPAADLDELQSPRSEIQLKFWCNHSGNKSNTYHTIPIYYMVVCCLLVPVRQRELSKYWQRHPLCFLPKLIFYFRALPLPGSSDWLPIRLRLH